MDRLLRRRLKPPSVAATDSAPPHGKLAALTTAVASGVLLGACARLGDRLPGFLSWLANIGGPWLLLAFAVGRLRGIWPVRAAAAALLTAVTAKYAVQHLQGGFSALHAVRRAAEWSVPAISSGLAFGWLGRRSIQRPKLPVVLVGLSLVIEGAGLLVGAIPAESAELRYTGQLAGTIVLTLEIAIGIAAISLAWTALPSRPVREVSL